MGTFFYGKDGYAIELEDRALAHLKVAILSLLCAGRSFELCLRRSIEAGSGRESLWMCPSSEIRFHFASPRPPHLSEPWVHAILATAGTPTGMRVVEEPTEAELNEPVRQGSVLTVGRP